MSKPSQRKLEKKKRKAKQQQAKRSQQRVSLAYDGKKYTTPELLPWLFQAELAIYSAYVITERELMDRQVGRALETLIHRLRKEPLPEFEDPSSFDNVIRGQNEEQLVIQAIRRGWWELLDEKSAPPRDQLIGVLRTVLGSVEWRATGPASQGYLNFVERYMNEAGMTVKLKEDEYEDEFEDDEADEGQLDELLRLGQQWARFPDSELGKPFQELASQLSRSGLGQDVAEICHQLLAEASGSPQIQLQLKAIGMIAHRAVQDQP